MCNILGGYEEERLRDRDGREEEPNGNEERPINHMFVSTSRRGRDAIRQETIESAENFLQASSENARSFQFLTFTEHNLLSARQFQAF